MRRREFITLLCGATTAWPFEALAQQAAQMPHVGIVMGSLDHSEWRLRLDAFLDSFKNLGWADGRNVRLDIRWSGGDPRVIAAQVRELVRLKPDVIFAAPTNVVIPLQKETRSISIVFAGVSDPVGQGVVKNLARPDGNITGFSNLEYSLMGKWLQLLKEAAPGIKRVGLLISMGNAASPHWYRMFNAVAPAFAIEPISLPIKDRGDIEGLIKSLASNPGGALIVPGDQIVLDPAVRRQIITLAATHRLPALYGEMTFAQDGGLICYGIDRVEPFRLAANYVDRILKGEKPSDLPVQQPTKFQFVINLKTAKALGLEMSPTFVGTADQVVE